LAIPAESFVTVVSTKRGVAMRKANTIYVKIGNAFELGAAGTFAITAVVLVAALYLWRFS
jgi:hypothetical protein